MSTIFWYFFYHFSFDEKSKVKQADTQINDRTHGFDRWAADQTTILISISDKLM